MAEVVHAGLRFHVQRLGAPREDARTVVFLHGLIMDNLSSWYFTAANPVAEIAEVVLYDLRGHGKSERPAAGYRVADMVDDLTGVLDQLELGSRPVDLVGNSFGGLLAIAFAIAHPERVSGVALVDAHLSDESWAAEMKDTLGLEGAERDAMIAYSFKNWLGRHSERKRNRLAKNASELVYETSLVADLDASPVFSDEDLRRVDCPVLAIYGENSDILARGERLQRVLPACELKILPNCSHSVLWEETAELRRALVEWVGREREPGALPAED